MPILLAIILVLLAVALLVWFSFNLIGWVIMLLVAGIVGWLADMVVPGRLPWGWLGAILAGLVGSWLGVALFGQIGPPLAGIPLISALLGAIIMVIVVEVLGLAFARRRYI